jgi:hypothetical protein
MAKLRSLCRREPPQLQASFFPNGYRGDVRLWPKTDVGVYPLRLVAIGVSIGSVGIRKAVSHTPRIARSIPGRTLAFRDASARDVMSGHLHRNRPCPLYPRKRTCAVH